MNRIRAIENQHHYQEPWKSPRERSKPCRDNPQEPNPPAVTDLTQPDYLGEIARIKYIQLAEMLSNIGVLKITGLDTLASYCETYQEVRELTEEVKKAPRVIEYGKGNRKIHRRYCQELWIGVQPRP